MTPMRTFLALCLVSVSMAAFANAQRRGPENAETYIDPKNAGPDFALQGEYVGEYGSDRRKMAAQVIALGDGEFQAVLLEGGLPGAGWDGKSRREVKGKRDGDKVVFDGDFKGTISNGTMEGQSAGAAVNLKRVTRVSPDEGEKPPAGAIVLFDGTNADAWDATAKIDDRHLLGSGTKTKQKFQDFMLHVEFILPFKPKARDQERGNSGIYMQDRYEIQVLDTFGHPPEFNGAASTYRQTAPKINMCYPPLQWQTYDIEFTAAKFDAQGKKTKNAVVTVRHNGVIVQDHTELKDKTGAGAKEGPEPGSIQLQGHNNPVFYRNIWIVDRK
ncbi:MAG TPA: DUF1080 domain-containing protein [Humisphaera sp.]|nr:DUF1080 domain-containing protein [Humisphaera sp.]